MSNDSICTIRSHGKVPYSNSPPSLTVVVVAQMLGDYHKTDAAFLQNKSHFHFVSIKGSEGREKKMKGLQVTGFTLPSVTFHEMKLPFPGSIRWRSGTYMRYNYLKKTVELHATVWIADECINKTVVVLQSVCCTGVSGCICGSVCWCFWSLYLNTLSLK